MRGLVAQWHKLALPVIRTKEFAITWADFLNGWQKVKNPYGTTLKAITADLDFTTPLPPSIEALSYGAAAQHLIRLCLGLQKHHGVGPFFLSVRMAGEVLGVHFTDASKMLTVLVVDGVLTLVSKGAGRYASRYRFAWSELQGIEAEARFDDEPAALSRTQSNIAGVN